MAFLLLWCFTMFRVIFYHQVCCDLRFMLPLEQQCRCTGSRGLAEGEEFDGGDEEESDADQGGKVEKPSGRGLMPRVTHGEELTTRKGAQVGDAEAGENSQSAHTLVVRRLKGKISDQEQELVSEKPWTLLGEVHAGDRPENRYFILLWNKSRS